MTLHNSSGQQSNNRLLKKLIGFLARTFLLYMLVVTPLTFFSPNFRFDLTIEDDLLARVIVSFIEAARALPENAAYITALISGLVSPILIDAMNDLGWDIETIKPKISSRNTGVSGIQIRNFSPYLKAYAIVSLVQFFIALLAIFYTERKSRIWRAPGLLTITHIRMKLLSWVILGFISIGLAIQAYQLSIGQAVGVTIVTVLTLKFSFIGQLFVWLIDDVFGINRDRWQVIGKPRTSDDRAKREQGKWGGFHWSGSSEKPKGHKYEAGSQQNNSDFSPPSNDADARYKEALATLNLEEGFSMVDAKTSYKQMMRRVHSDTGGSDHLAKIVNIAWETIKLRHGWI